MLLEKAWHMAEAFFGDFMSHDFRGRTHEQDVEILKSVGLTSDFWTG